MKSKRILFICSIIALVQVLSVVQYLGLFKVDHKNGQREANIFLARSNLESTSDLSDDNPSLKNSKPQPDNGEIVLTNLKSLSESKISFIITNASEISKLGTSSGATVWTGKTFVSGNVANSKTSIRLTTTHKFLSEDEIPRIRIGEVNCAKLIAGDPVEQHRADVYQTQLQNLIIPDDDIYKQASNCSAFLSDRKYILKPSSDDEASFPLAFSILLYKDVEQFERLLRVIYRPQNFYCVHVDKKSATAVQDAVGAIVKCFENVFMAPEQIDVQWGKFSVLEPELNCMKELLKYKKWRYFINLTGQEFPLKTNWEIVEILKTLNGANNVAASIKWRNLERFTPFLPAPLNITVTKGSVHIAVTRGYVDYAINNATSLRILEWVKRTLVPDETYFSMLNHNPQLGVPGSYRGIPEVGVNRNLFIARFKNWETSRIPCKGKHSRHICIFGVGDLPLLTGRMELFANKFHLDYQPLALDCLEEFYFNRTREELTSGPKVNRTFYASLGFVKNHI